MLEHNRLVAITVGDTPPITAILHPEAGRGLDLAKRYGSAERYPDELTGEWTGRDPDSGEWIEEPT